MVFQPDRAKPLVAARKDKVTVAVYEKGPKVLVQGKGLEDFVTFILEPEVLGAYASGDVWCSSLLEFLGLLINGEWQRVPILP